MKSQSEMQKIRKANKITLKELARITGIHRHTIARIEQGNENVTVKNLKAYLGAIGGFRLMIGKEI